MENDTLEESYYPRRTTKVKMIQIKPVDITDTPG